MKNLTTELYKKMYLIRIAEEKIRERYPRDEIKTPIHLAIGEEAIAVGVCSALKKTDQVFGTYRNHGIYLTFTQDVYGFFAELFGKKTGLSGGKAGSMHIMKPENNFMVTSAIVGGTIPIAMGAAFANLYLNNKRVVVVFFGDGAIDEGVFWESINFSSLKKIPIIFVCEDNGFAIHSSTNERHGYQSIASVVSKFNCHVIATDTTDVEKIYVLTKKAVKYCLKNQGPVFMHLKYYRYLQHVGPNQDFHFGYRSEKEYKKWLKIDPLKVQRNKLLKRGWENSEIVKIEKNIEKEVDLIIEKTAKDFFPSQEDLLTNVYYEK